MSQNTTNHTKQIQPFQSFFLAKEVTTSEALPMLLHFLNQINLEPTFKKLTCRISTRYGKRIIINTNHHEKNLKNVDFIEIVEYDPLKNIVLLIGQKQPPLETSIHSLLYRARNDINAIAQFSGEKLPFIVPDNIAVVQNPGVHGSFEEAKQILKTIGTTNIVKIKNKSLIVCGSNLQNIKSILTSLIK